MQRISWRVITLSVLAFGLATSVALADSVERRFPSETPVKGEGPAVPHNAPAGCVAIPDDGYNGTIGSMACVSVPGISATITDVDVITAINHTWIGDLTIKVQNPAATTTVTLVSRPGLAEAADDGAGCCGDSSNMAETSPLLFNDDGAGPSAETMGGTITTSQIVCLDDGICEFTPNAGAATPGALSAFDGQNAAGTWLVCAGDSVGADAGDLCSASIVFNGLVADLAISKADVGGVVDGAPFDYSLQVTNNGPADATGVVVSDTLPASLVYVGDDCGGLIAGQDFTWNVGSLANGNSATCTLTVQLAAPGCVPVTNTATVTSGVSDTNPSNNSSTASNAAEEVADPSFEGGTPNGSWTEASTNFGTPLCTIGGCGQGGGTGPHTGDWWAWFGGITAFEEGSVSQSITIPPGAVLTFWLEAPVCGTGGASDFMEVTVDGNQVFYIDSTSPLCNVVGYSQQTVDLSAYGDGGAHTLTFHSIVNSGQITNYFVDDVSVSATVCVPGYVPPVIQEIPTLGTAGFAALGLLLAFSAFALLRRRAA